MPSFSPVMLVVMDGWGLRAREHGNAVVQAKTPNYDRWSRELERSIVHTSGEFVGLAPGQMGNSEVGHQNLGAGRVVYQDITLIDKNIESGEFARHPKLLGVMEKVVKTGKKLHLVGMLSPGGVHSHLRHFYALLEVCAQRGVDPVIHGILDGRDTPPKSFLAYWEEIEKRMADLNVGRVASLAGRYYAMDRDKRWDRTGKFWRAMVRGEGKRAKTVRGAVEQGYAEDLYDELIEPTVIEGVEGKVEAGDVVVFWNFRSDRMRQIAQAVAGGEFEGAEHFEKIPDVEVVTMTEYMKGLKAVVLFGNHVIEKTLACVLSQHGVRQYHCAETEKYPHVTYFFNGRREKPWKGEMRKMTPSPKVKTYDLKPEMSAYELTEETLRRLEKERDDFVLINFANPDLVGHTGSLPAAIRACEVVDECVGRLVEKVLAQGGVAIVTADHGNSERMIHEVTGEPHTSHTVGPVPLFVIAKEWDFDLHMYGKLADVAPTILELMGIEKPAEMTGRSLIRGFVKKTQALN